MSLPARGRHILPDSTNVDPASLTSSAGLPRISNSILFSISGSIAGVFSSLSRCGGSGGFQQRRLVKRQMSAAPPPATSPSRGKGASRQVQIWISIPVQVIFLGVESTAETDSGDRWSQALSRMLHAVAHEGAGGLVIERVFYASHPNPPPGPTPGVTPRWPRRGWGRGV